MLFLWQNIVAVCVSLLQCITKEAAGSGASSGAWTLHGPMQLDNVLVVSALLHPSDRN